MLQVRAFTLFLFPGMFFTAFRCSLTCHPPYEPSLATLSTIPSPSWRVPTLSSLLSCLSFFLGTCHYLPFYIFCFFTWIISYIAEHKHQKRVWSMLSIAGSQCLEQCPAYRKQYTYSWSKCLVAPYGQNRESLKSISLLRLTSHLPQTFLQRFSQRQNPGLMGFGCR